MSTHSRSRAAVDSMVEGTLRRYAERGVLRGFSRGASRRQRTTFLLRWHHDHVFECLLDRRRRTLRFPALLPGAASHDALVGALREYVAARHAPERPEHRRIDEARARAQVRRSGDDLSLTLHVEDDAFEYGTRKLIHLVQEIFLDFLLRGEHYEYLVEAFGLDADAM